MRRAKLDEQNRYLMRLQHDVRGAGDDADLPPYPVLHCNGKGDPGYELGLPGAENATGAS